jgi:hypothetical protein
MCSTTEEIEKIVLAIIINNKEHLALESNSLAFIMEHKPDEIVVYKKSTEKPKEKYQKLASLVVDAAEKQLVTVELERCISSER